MCARRFPASLIRIAPIRNVVQQIASLIYLIVINWTIVKSLKYVWVWSAHEKDPKNAFSCKEGRTVPVE